MSVIFSLFIFVDKDNVFFSLFISLALSLYIHVESVIKSLFVSHIQSFDKYLWFIPISN